MHLSRAAIAVTLAVVAAVSSPSSAQTQPDASATAPRPPFQPTPEMLRLEEEAVAAVDKGEWETADARLRALLDFERRTYGPDALPVAATLSWLIHVAQKRGRPAEEVEALARERLRIAELHPQERETLAISRHLVGQLLWVNGRSADALPFYGGSLDMLTTVRTPSHPDLILVREEYGKALADAGKADAAFEQQRLVFEAFRNDPATPPEKLIAAAETYAYALHAAGRHADTETPLRAAIKARRKSAASVEGSLAKALSYLGFSLRRLGRYADAEPVQREALALWIKLRGERHAAVATEAHGLGLTLYHQRKYIEAYKMFALTVSIEDEQGGAPPNHVEDQYNTAFKLQFYDVAEKVARRLVAFRQGEVPVNEAGLARAHSFLGDVFYRTGRLTEAEAEQRRVLELTRDESLRPSRMVDLAFSIADQGRGEEAEPLVRQAMSLTEAATGLNSPETALMVHHLANLLSRRDDWERAEALLRRALAIQQAQPKPDPVMIATLKLHIGMSRTNQGDHTEGARYLLEAFKERRALYEPGHPETVAPIRQLAMVFAKMGAYDMAETYLKQIVQLHEKSFGPDHPETAEALQELAYAVYMQDRYADAEPLMKRARAITAADLSQPKVHARVTANLAVLLVDAGKPKEALPLFRESSGVVVRRLGAAAEKSWSKAEQQAFRFMFRNSIRAYWDASAARAE